MLHSIPRRSLALFIILFTFTSAIAQSTITIRTKTNDAPHWTIDLELGFPIPVSQSMRAWDFQFQGEMAKDYNNSRYPFAALSGANSAGGICVEYRFVPGNLSAYISGSWISFSQVVASDSVSLNITSFGLGGKYSFDISPSFDFFTRLGINGSYISGQVGYPYPDIALTTSNPRFGFEAGLGFDWNPWSILFLQLFTNYSDVNVIGKSYTAPSASPPNPIYSRGLNDGANPNNPNDKPRTIDYWMTGLSIGVRF